MSKIAVLSEGAPAPPGVVHSPPLDRLYHLLGTLQAAEGSSPLHKEGGVMTSRAPASTLHAFFSNLCETSCS